MTACIVMAQAPIDYKHANLPATTSQIPDGGYTTLAAGCEAAVTAGVPLSLSKKWLALPTQTLPCNIQPNGGTIQPASGQTITLPCPSASGAAQIFDVSRGGAVAFDSACGVQAVPQWFGALGNAVHNDTPAIQAAINALMAGSQLYFPAGSYRAQKLKRMRSDSARAAFRSQDHPIRMRLYWRPRDKRPSTPACLQFRYGCGHIQPEFSGRRLHRRSNDE